MGLDGAVRLDGLRVAAETASAAELDAARFGFDRAKPARSARRRVFFVQVVAAGLLIAAVVWAFDVAPALSWHALHGAAFSLFAVAMLWRLAAASSLTPTLSRIAEQPDLPLYTVLCPLYREANVAPDLVAALARIDYPTAALDIKLLVEADDPDTILAALAVAGGPHIEVVIIPACAPRTKPKALNVGLARARGEFVVVYDAEDRPHPLQLRAAVAAFEDGGPELACVQAPLTIDNADVSWIARQFAAEYAIQFGEIIPLTTRLGLPVQLGGTSNHFRTETLREAGGWDSFNVTEDADLGYRLARDGYSVGFIAPPTAEEAPITFGAWLKQRSRWIKGHIQTWLVLMRDPVRCAREMSLIGFASMQLALAGGVIAALVHGPLAFIVLTAVLSPYDLLAPADFALALFGYCVAVFSALTASALSGQLSHIRAALTMPFYWPLSTIAAVRALWELVFKPHHWAKTQHGLSPRQRRAEASLPPRLTAENELRRHA